MPHVEQSCLNWPTGHDLAASRGRERRAGAGGAAGG